MGTLAEIVRVADLAAGTRTDMLAIMETCFEDVNASTFDRELAEKDWAILLREKETGELFGFSTLALMRIVVHGTPVQAFFSGDTLILPDHWGSLALEKAWLQFVFSHAEAEPECKWYWFLICKGYRTYRYLPVYFRHFYPAPRIMVPPFENLVLQRLAEKRFGRFYNGQTGIIRCPNDYRLRPSIDDAAQKAGHDPRIAFFCERNPEWSQGTELACLTELSRDNLRRPALRSLGKEDHP